MNLPPDDLEKLIHGTVRDLPPRRAPRTLELRVLAELERRAAQPWWHKSYAHWPSPVRAGFLVFASVVAAGFVAVLFAAVHRVDPAQIATALSERFEWLAIGRRLAESAAVATVALWRSIPPLWLYGAIVFVAACYATLIGVGAAAYRTLRVQR